MAALAGSGLEGLHPDFVDPGDRPCVFTTLRWDAALIDCPENTAASCHQPSPVYLFEHHWSRLQVAKWGTSWYHEDEVPVKARQPGQLFQILNAAVQRWQRTNCPSAPASASGPAEALRIKLRCYVGGKMSAEIVPVARLPYFRLFPKSLDVSREDFGPPFTVFLDTRSTEAGELTMYKTSQRDFYARARHEANIGSLTDPREVLLYAHDDLVFDGSISTPYFSRNGQWVTPASACGGQQGVTRRWALENRLAVESSINIRDLRDGELMWLSNAVKGYFPAIFRASAQVV